MHSARWPVRRRRVHQAVAMASIGRFAVFKRDASAIRIAVSISLYF